MRPSVIAKKKVKNMEIKQQPTKLNQCPSPCKMKFVTACHI